MVVEKIEPTYAEGDPIRVRGRHGKFVVTASGKHPDGKTPGEWVAFTDDERGGPQLVPVDHVTPNQDGTPGT